MRMYDLIDKKKKGLELHTQEIQYIIDHYVINQIPEEQMAAFLMAVYFNQMTDRELSDLTLFMANSSECVDLSEITGIKVDKHSTGGVGDKTTLIVAPIVASCGGTVAKMSGKGLGFTGGTIDKLQSIAGFLTDLSKETFVKNVNEIGISIISQTAQIAYADKKLYDLRDRTAIVDSIPLIASSIMSKKLASGSDKIVLDVTYGSGAFMKKEDDAIELARKMVAIGEQNKKETVAIVTNMDQPLGYTIGNLLEVKEAIEVLKGEGRSDIKEVCIELAANMLYLGKEKAHELDYFRKLAEKAICNGSAFQKFKQFVTYQHGDVNTLYNIGDYFIDSPSKEIKSYPVICAQEGYIIKMDTEQFGIASMILGAGREKKDSKINYLAGIEIHKKIGDYVKNGELLAILYSNKEEAFIEAAHKLIEAYTIKNHGQPGQDKMILARVDKTGIEWL